MVTVPTLLRKARSTALARAHADRGAPAVTAAAAAPDADANHAQNNFVNNSQATDNGRPPPVPAKDTNSPRFLHRFSTIRDYRTSRIDLSTAVESESSIQAREKQLDKQSSISQLRRRLVRKASTFNLNSRRLVALSPVTNNSSNRRSAHLFLDADTDSEIYPPTNTHERSPSAPEILRSDTASTVYSTVAETIISRCELPNATDHDSTSANTAVFTPSQPSSHQNRETREINTFPSTWAVQEPVYTPTGTEPHLNTERHIGKTMAATPPLPYEVLKKITVDVSQATQKNQWRLKMPDAHLDHEFVPVFDSRHFLQRTRVF